MLIQHCKLSLIHGLTVKQKQLNLAKAALPAHTQTLILLEMLRQTNTFNSSNISIECSVTDTRACIGLCVSCDCCLRQCRIYICMIAWFTWQLDIRIYFIK